MAFRTFQLCVVFTIGLWTSPATAAASISGSSSLGGSLSGGGGGGGGSSGVGAASRASTATATGGSIPLSLVVRQPTDVIVARGQSATLHCNLNTTDQPYELYWYYGDQRIESNDTRRQVQEDGSLYIRRVGGKRISSVEGNYSCFVKNRYGTILTMPAKLRIAMLAKDFGRQPENIVAELTQPTYLSCEIQSTPSAMIEWERDRKPLPLSTRYVPLPSGDLLITTTQQSDAGSYRCKATNEISKKYRYSNEGVLSIAPASTAPQSPKFLQLYRAREQQQGGGNVSITTHLGRDLRLYCAAIGWPKTNLHWTNNVSAVISNSSILSLKNLTAAHTGTYYCVAQNSVAKIKQIYNVRVVQAPYFTKTPVSQWFPSARAVRLECKAEGIPTPNIRWLKNGKPLVWEGRMKLLPFGVLVSHTFTTDSGIYQCIAENEFGRIWSGVQLIANTSGPATPPPMNVRCSSYNATSICLQWDEPPNVTANAYTIHSFNADLGHEYLTMNTYLLAEKLQPNKNYTFYVRLYLKSVSSDRSENITCQTVLIGNRNLKLKALSNTTLKVEWTSLSSDTPCGGVAEYKLQWRRYGHASNNAKFIFKNHYIITNLTPSQKYEVRVQTASTDDEELPWKEFAMPSKNDNIDVEPSLTKFTTELPVPKTVMAPTNLEAEPISPNNITLTWIDPRDTKDKLPGGYYMICYNEVRPGQSCENGNFIKSTTTTKEIYNLSPFTQYVFKVRSHNLDGSYGQFSHSVECKTLEHVPSTVTNLLSRPENSTSVFIRWRKPSVMNGQLLHYIISYTYQNHTLEQWPTIVLPANVSTSPLYSRWRESADTVSMHLTPLKSGRKYKVIVRAGTNAGLSLPSNQITIETASMNGTITSTYKPPISPEFVDDELDRNQKLGIILGVALALLCIVFCISCMIFRRRCLKARARERARLSAQRATNGQSASTSMQPAGTAPVRALCQPLATDGQCVAEAHELQCLVTVDRAHIPMIDRAHLDTKGGVSYPNGQANGLKYVANGHIPNGNVHITENPQFDSYDCNGHYNSSECHQLLNVDRNLNTDDSLLDETFNSTQLTSLEETLPIATARTLSPVLGPNG